LLLGLDLNDPSFPCVNRSGFVMPYIPLNATAKTSISSCSSGAIEVEVFTGRPPFEYRLNGNSQFSNRFNGLEPGDYEWEVIDGDGQRVSGTILVPDNRPQISLWVGNAPCTEQNGSTTRVQFDVNRGGNTTGNYTYELINDVTNQRLAVGSAPFLQDLSLDVTGVLAGDRIVLKVTPDDTPNCIFESDKVQAASPEVTFQLNAPNGVYPSCSNQGADIIINASVNLNATTPVQNNLIYEYELLQRRPNRRFVRFGGINTTTQSSFSLTGIPPGDYRVIAIFDPTGFDCQRQLEFTVLSPGSLSASPPEVRNVSCHGFGDGSATIAVRASDGEVTYTWFPEGEPDSVLSYGPEVVNLVPGDYTVTLKDQRTCASEAVSYNFSITEPNPLGQVSARALENSCILEASFSEGEGTAPYTFSWRNQSSEEVKRDAGVQAEDGIVRSAPDFNGEIPDTFFAVVIDDNGCTAVSNSVELAQPAIERTYEICVRWVSRGVVGEKREKPTYVRPGIGEVQGRAITAIQDQISDCVSEQTLSLDSYLDRCFDPGFLADTMTLSYQLGYEHHTLFYFDRSGSLVQTVPPAGVDDSLKTRDNLPNHSLITSYHYNSLNQLTQQTTPDGGTTKYLYNDLNQLRFSQSARQADPQDLENIELQKTRFSYTKYDKLGRTIEVGESFLAPDQTFESLNDQQADQSFPAMRDSRDITRTVYNEVDTSVTYLGEVGTYQRYLDNRISYAWRLNRTGEKVTTYYSYDPHGNVEWLVQDLPEIGKSYIGYHYDLISGNVLQMDYNRGFVDQFFHRYQYDEDNRLTQVETSTDAHIWDRDARYAYYAHGPLKYTVLGEDNLQKVDYAYTLQSWLKSINSPILNVNDEEGAGLDKKYPQDVFGMALGYYPGDFKHTGSLLDESSSLALTDLVSQKPLYNGNI
ncbi:MAG: hypothetical protein AAF242_12855, partial [Bacteroidota bacterium]